MDGVLVGGPTLFLVREELDEVVDSKDGDGCLCGELQTLGFDHGGFIHSRLLVVSRLSIYQVQPDPKCRHTVKQSNPSILNFIGSQFNP